MSNSQAVFPLYEKIQKGVVYLRAKAKGENVPGWTNVKAAPTDWLMGHPAGAVFMGDVSVDMSAAKEPIFITEFVALDDKKRAIASFAPTSPIRIEPECEARISRAIVVPRDPPPAPPPAPEPQPDAPGA